MALLTNDWQFCPRCAALLRRGEENSVVCEGCGYVFYAGPYPTAAALIENEAGQVLLIRRGHNPGKGRWDVIGGFVSENEEALDTLVREVEEEIGVKVEPGDFVGVFGSQYRKQRNLNLYWRCRIVAGVPQLTAEAVEIGWFAASEIPWDELAFPESGGRALTRWAELQR